MGDGVLRKIKLREEEVEIPKIRPKEELTRQVVETETRRRVSS